jgi:hypothetical protein
VIPAERPGAIPAERAGVIPAERPGAIPAEQAGAIPAERAGVIPAERPGAIPAERPGAIPAERSPWRLNCNPDHTNSITNTKKWAAEGEAKFEALGKFFGGVGGGVGFEYETEYTLDNLTEISASQEVFQRRLDKISNSPTRVGNTLSIIKVAWIATPVVKVTSKNKEKLSAWMDKLKNILKISVSFETKNEEVYKITANKPIVIGYIIRPLEEIKEVKKVGGKTINVYSYKEQELAQYGPLDLESVLDEKRREERERTYYGIFESA